MYAPVAHIEEDRGRGDEELEGAVHQQVAPPLHALQLTYRPDLRPTRRTVAALRLRRLRLDGGSGASASRSRG